MDRHSSGAQDVETQWKASAPSASSSSAGWSKAMVAAGPLLTRVSEQSPVARRVPRSISGLQHELQQPNRRLSSHQLLLLTPFGATLPAGALRENPQVIPRPLVPIPFTPSTAAIPMTRSNSLPVLSLQELDSLRQRDEDHGIIRGGQFAWVSQEVDANTEIFELSPLSEDVQTAPSPPRFSSATFRNPFLPDARATEEDYSFDGSPKTRPAPRRASEASSQASGSASPTNTLKTYRPSAPRSKGVPLDESSPPSPMKHTLVRYKSSPARTSDLGLNINLVDSTTTEEAPSRARARQGSWASVTVLDGAMEIINVAVVDPHVARRASIIQLPADFVPLRGTFDLTMAEPDSPEAKQPKRRRSRLESIDSAFPNFGEVRTNVALSRWVNRFSSWPRRGSLAVDVVGHRSRKASG